MFQFDKELAFKSFHLPPTFSLSFFEVSFWQSVTWRPRENSLSFFFFFVVSKNLFSFPFVFFLPIFFTFSPPPPFSFRLLFQLAKLSVNHESTFCGGFFFLLFPSIVFSSAIENVEMLL